MRCPACGNQKEARNFLCRRCWQALSYQQRGSLLRTRYKPNAHRRTLREVIAALRYGVADKVPRRTEVGGGEAER